MSLSAKEAAEKVGLTKQGIIKAIRTGIISAKKSSKGEWLIEPVELFRIYPPVNSVDVKPKAQVDSGIQVVSTKVDTEKNLEKALLESQNTHLKDKIALLEKRLEEIQQDKSYLQDQLKTSLTLIEDMRNKPPKTPPEARKSFFGRILS